MNRALLPRLIAGLLVVGAFLVGFAVIIPAAGNLGVETTGDDLDFTDGETSTLFATGTTMAPGNPSASADKATLEIEGSAERVADQSAADPSSAAPPSAARSSAALSSSTGSEVLLRGDTARYESIRNTDPKFFRYADRPASEIGLDLLLEPSERPDNGGAAEGQFRVACEYSHFGADDPIIYPGQPGAAHLHMFFGNTAVDAHTTEESLLNTGGGTCSGFELNRSGYWVPALLDGRGNAVVPEQIILYYKTKFPRDVVAMPQGLQMLAGNIDSESFNVSYNLAWSCGDNGHSYNRTNRIPDCGGDTINASIVFPNCWDGVNLRSDDFVSHLRSVDETLRCPRSHPKRLPQISILIYWPGVDSVDGWHLSSDRTDGFNGPPGGTLHADWWGGWNDDAMNLWINNCMRRARNCSGGQTGTSRQLAQLSPLDNYEGEHFLPLPS